MIVVSCLSPQSDALGNGIQVTWLVLTVGIILGTWVDKVNYTGARVN